MVFTSANEKFFSIGLDIPELYEYNKEEFYEKLLTLNATDMIHGAYGIEGSSIVLVDTLEGDTMDIEELQASLDAIGLALTQHYKVLSGYRK